MNQRKDKSPKIKDWKVIDKGKIKGEKVCSIKYQQIYNKYKVILPKVICEEILENKDKAQRNTAKLFECPRKCGKSFV